MKKHFLTLNLFGLILIPSLCSLTLTSCSFNGVVFANYEGYMSPDLMDRLHHNGNVKFVPYATNEDILAKFKKSYDIAVPSTYMVLELIKKGYLSKIEWKDLNIYSSGKRHNEPVGELIANANPSDSLGHKAREDLNNAQSLFSNTVDDIIDSIDIWAHKPENHYYEDDESLLDYGLPYFLQDLMFAYHGPYISGLPSPTPHATQWYSETNWNDISDVISTKSPNVDNRFKRSGHGPQMAMVDDSRSIFDMCHLIGGTPPETNVNPSEQESTGIDDLRYIYESFTDKFNKGSFLLNSDSQQVLYTFSKPTSNNDDFAYSNGIISWNGDVLYSVMGAGIDKWSNVWTSANTHIVKPLTTLVALDMLVINKNVANSSKKDSVYQILHDTCLQGCEQEPNFEGIGKKNDNGEFINGPTLNFNYQGYTPTLWNLNEFVAQGLNDDTLDNSYFAMEYPDEPEKIKLCAATSIVNFEEGLLELPLDDLTKSNMSIAWTKVKEGL